jgi:ubiquinone/menaquinone biosynthesis C-methylase UbiE
MEFYLKRLRANRISNILRPFIQNVNNILDIGSGDCIVAEQIQKDIGINITCIDRIDYNKTNLPLLVCQSENLPYEDESFDAVMLIFVLHHSKDFRIPLEEAIRVCKNRLIIIEDIYSNILERWFICLIDMLWNFRNSVAIPFNFLKNDEWTQVFPQLNLKLEHKEAFRLSFRDPVKRILFVLSKDGIDET